MLRDVPEDAPCSGRSRSIGVEDIFQYVFRNSFIEDMRTVNVSLASIACRNVVGRCCGQQGAARDSTQGPM